MQAETQEFLVFATRMLIQMTQIHPPPVHLVLFRIFLELFVFFEEHLMIKTHLFKALWMTLIVYQYLHCLISWKINSFIRNGNVMHH